MPTVRAKRGLDIRCAGWRQEGLLRMLENTVENGERPEDLIIYSGTAQAARNWESYDEIVRQLIDLAHDETLVIQSGKPVAVFRTTTESPRVVIANTNLVGNWATWERYHELKSRDLIMWGQYTAGDWQYIGQQGILQSTYETLAVCARTNFGGDLSGRLFLSSGLGAMGGAQPFAAKFLGAASIIVEVDESSADRHIESGYLEQKTSDIGEAMQLAAQAVESGEVLSLALIGNAAELLPELLDRGLNPDIVTDQTSAHDVRHGYVPAGITLDEVEDLRKSDPLKHERLALESIHKHVEAMVGFHEQGAVVFEYGNAIREQALLSGYKDAMSFEGFVKLFVRPSFLLGRGPCRWVVLSGDPADLRIIDEAMLIEFDEDPSVTGWIQIAMANVPIQGLPARTSWLDPDQRLRFGALVNRLVREGTVSAPVAMTRDHLDTGSVAQPTRETEGMKDGTDGVADWPILNALLNASAGADLVALHQGGGSGMGGSISAGVTLIIDGTDDAQAKLDRVLRVDPGIGVVRHADAGYEDAIAAVAKLGIVAPMVGDAD